jgi:E3 ubiquitin-protein ligase UHRF1
VTLGKRGYVGGDEAFVDDDEDANNERQRKAQKLGVRLHNPKRFGHIPGVEVGTWWPSRMDASTAAVHA